MELKEFEARLKQLNLSVLSKAEADAILKKIIPPKGMCHDFATIATEYNKI